MLTILVGIGELLQDSEFTGTDEEAKMKYSLDFVPVSM